MSEPKAIYGKPGIGELNEHILVLEKSIEDTTWAQADAYLKARELFGLKEFAKKTDRIKKLGTMKVYANVAESYPSVNRFTLLTFRHHMVVMKSDRRYELLQKAVDNKWSAERLRQEAYPPTPKKDPLPEPVKPAQTEAKIWLEPEVYRPSYDEILETMNQFSFSEEGMVFLRNYGKLMFTIIQGLWDDPRTIVLVGDHFEFRVIPKSMEEGIEGPIPEGPSV